MLNIDLPYDPAIPLVCVYTQEKFKKYVYANFTQMFIAALFIIAKK